MNIGEKEIKKGLVLLLILLLGILSFFLIKPIILSITGGLILAYMFNPIYRFIILRVKSKNLSAALVSLLVVLIIILPLWFLLPILIQQIFELFELSQKLDLNNFVGLLFPSGSEQFVAQITITVNSFVSKIGSSTLGAIVNYLLDLPNILLQFAVIAFVFFFGLRDGKEMASFVSGLSPLSKDQEKIMVKKFKDITYSIVYGQIIIGFVQGISAGIGLFLVGMPNALVLTFLAIFLSIIPIAGPAFIWVPVAIYLLLKGNPLIAIFFISYNLFFVSTIDNLLRTYMVSKRANLHAAIVLIGMIGGLIIFGFLGIILGPLIMAYLLAFLEAYRNKTLSSMFSE